MIESTSKSSIDPLKLLTRESLLKANSELIAQLQDRLKAKRFRPQEGDSRKLAYIRVFIQALQVHNAILKRLRIRRNQEEIGNSGKFTGTDWEDSYLYSCILAINLERLGR